MISVYGDKVCPSHQWKTAANKCAKNTSNSAGDKSTMTPMTPMTPANKMMKLLIFLES